MTNSEFQKYLKDSLAHIKEKTVYELTKEDIAYKESMHELSESEGMYMLVQKELKEEHKRIIEKYITDLEINNSDLSDLAYISGMIDIIRFLELYKIYR